MDPVKAAPSVTLKPPFPWFGGKSRAAQLVWSRFGDVTGYVEPFFGSGAILFRRPVPFSGVETVNDADGFVANFWRATQRDPEAVAYHADNPVNENDLHARHSWLVREAAPDLVSRLEGDPDYFDAKVAGWWAWGISCWIGSGFCSGKGPWQSVVGDDGIARLLNIGNSGQGVKRQLPHLGNAGQGVNRKLPHLGDAGKGVNRQLPLTDYFLALADRLRDVRVCCGDWSRVMGPSVVRGPSRSAGSRVAILLDPPYADTANRESDLYRVDCQSVAHQVRAWAIANGDNPQYRIALCGYDGEHAMPGSWECVEWKAGQGYGSQGRDGYANANRERIWFSPACVKVGRAAMLPLTEVAS